MLEQVSGWMIDNIWLLQLLKIALFVGMFMVGASYMIPKGVEFLLEWKTTKKRTHLSTGVTFCAAGVILLLYLLAVMIMPDDIHSMGPK